MATQKKSALAKLLAVLIAVILVFGSLVAILFAYTWFAFRTPYANITPSPFTATLSPTPSSITPSPGTSPPTSQSPSTTSTTPSTGTPTPTPTVVPLADAISQGLVQASFSGRGSCAGDCIMLTIKSLAAYPLEITPPPLGTVLTTTSPGAQSMVLLQLQGIDYGSTYTPASTMLLTNQTSVSYVFRAYCLDFHKANPSSSDQFTMTGTASPDIIKVLNAASTQPASVASITAVQVAIWVVTENVSQQDLSKNFQSGVSEINNAKTILQAAGIDTSGKALFAAPAAT
jgi:hypothetical protein